MTRREVLCRKRWMRLALPGDVQQLIALADLCETTEHRKAVLLDYLLRSLRHEVWDRVPTRAPRTPHILRPSKRARATGYRTDSAAHSAARRNL